MSDIYLQITETPAVVTLSAPVVSSVMVNTVTVANVVSVNVVTMPSISIQAPSVTTVIGTVTVGVLPSLTNNTNFASVGQSILQGFQSYGTVPVSFDGQSLQQSLNGTLVNATCLTSTNRIGVVTIGGGTVTIGAGTAQIGSVTASISGTVPVSGTFFQATQPVSGTFWQATQPVSLTTLPALVAGTAQIGSVTASISGTVPVSGTFFQATQPASLASLPALAAGTNQIGSVTASISGTVPVSGTFWQATQPVSGTFYQATQPVSLASVPVHAVTLTSTTVTVSSLPALAAGTAQIGSVTASISNAVTVGNSITIGSLPAISGTVTANLAISSTAITSGSFASLTSATLVPANTSRKMATVYNLGAGKLFVNAGTTATTIGGGFMVALSSGDYFECGFTTTTLSAIYATTGTASWASY